MTTRALQVECLLTPLYDYRDNAICSGYSVYFYSAGTSTAKNVWTEKEKTNPYTSRTLGSDGTIQVYGDGVYKIVIKDGDGTAVYTWDNIKIQYPNIAVLSKSGTYTATVEDDYILVTTTAGNVTINLYAAALFTHPLCIKNIGANSVVIDASGAELIEGATTYTISTQDAAVWLFSNGSAWYIANDVSISATDAVNLVAAFEGAKKMTAHATTIDIETNNEYLRQLNAAGDGYVNLIKANASNQTEVATNAILKGTPLLESGATINTNNAYLTSKDAAGTGTVNIIKANASNRAEIGVAINTFQAHNGTYTIDFPTNGMANAKFMLGNSSTIAWFYLNTAPPGWKVTATGADMVLAVSGGAGLYNANGGTAGGETWANLKAHTHTGPSHAHGPGAHTHTLPNSEQALGADYSAAIPSITIAGGLLSSPVGGGATTMYAASATTGAPSAADTAAAGTGASGAQSTADVRPTASIGKLFQMDTA